MSCGKAESSWSSIPILLLWLIKDKLDIFDDVALTAVCRNWRSASSKYPRKQSVGDRIPWIMQKKQNNNKSSRDVICISRKKKFTVDMPEFVNSCLLFSKCGWFFMRRKNCLKPDDRSRSSFFLRNIFTKATIEMPDVADVEAREYYGSFTTHAGYPQHIVLLIVGRSREFTYKTAYVGDFVWTEHATEHHVRFEGYGGLFIFGGQVYYFNVWGKMIIYNMANQTWRVLQVPENEIGANYFVEHEGHILKLCSDRDRQSYSFSRYNDNDTSWEKLNIVNDLIDTSFYLSRCHSCCSCPRDNGLKAYVLHPNYYGFRPSRVRSFDVLSHDFLDGGTQTLELPYQICSSAEWVDIG